MYIATGASARTRSAAANRKIAARALIMVGFLNEAASGGAVGSKQFVNHPADVDDRHRPALGSAELLARVDPQLMEHRRVEVFRPERRCGGFLGSGVALA